MIELMNLNMIYNPGTDVAVNALHNVNLKLNPGTWYTIVGPNGSGKSTLLRILAGEISPFSGSIYYKGNDITKWKQERKAKVFQFIEQDSKDNLVSSMTIEENLLLPLNSIKFPSLSLARNQSKRMQIQQCLEYFKMGLEDRLSTQVRFLSGGQRQAVVVAKTILRKADIFLLDEFVAALDLKTAPRLLEVMQNFAKTLNSTVIMVTHDLEQAISCVGELVFLNRGEVFFKSGKERVSKEKLLSIYSDALAYKSNGEKNL